MTTIDLNKKIQQAMSDKSFIHAKSNGKLLNIKPKVGWTIVIEGGETGTVLREANSTGDFTYRPKAESDLLSTPPSVRRNIINGDILGYFTNGH